MPGGNEEFRTGTSPRLLNLGKRGLVPCEGSFAAGGNEGLEGLRFAGHPGTAGVEDGEAEGLGRGDAGQPHAHLAMRDNLQGAAAIEGIETVRVETDLNDVGQGNE